MTATTPAHPPAAPADPAAPAGPPLRRSATLAVVGALALVGVAATALFGLVVTPPDAVQGELVRLIYVHPPVAWVLYLGIGLTALGSALYLWPRTRSPRWDRLAGASGEVATVFGVLTLVSGSIWGRPTWGVWWTWDARLTLSALIVAMLGGYLALRRVDADPEERALRAAVVGLLVAVLVPINHMAVEWWRTLHQPATVLRTDLDPQLDGAMLATMLLGFVSFTLVFAWLVGHRVRQARVEAAQADAAVERALAERRAEAPHGGAA